MCRQELKKGPWGFRYICIYIYIYESGPQTKNVLFFKTIFIYSTIQQHKGWNNIILGNMYFHRTGNKVSSINSVATVESKP